MVAKERIRTVHGNILGVSPLQHFWRISQFHMCLSPWWHLSPQSLLSELWDKMNWNQRNLLGRQDPEKRNSKKWILFVCWEAWGPSCLMGTIKESPDHESQNEWASVYWGQEIVHSLWDWLKFVISMSHLVFERPAVQVVVRTGRLFAWVY